MITVFQSETGGQLSFPFSGITAVSGYIDVVNKQRLMYRFDGSVQNNVLYVSKSGLSNTLHPAEYIILPQLIDSGHLVYFIDPVDLQIIEVPDFFNYAVLTSGNSILVRLDELQSAIDALSASDKTYRHVQSSAASVWTINHNLNKFVNVLVIDSSGDLVVGQVQWLSLNTIRVTFSAAFSGEAYCN